MLEANFDALPASRARAVVGDPCEGTLGPALSILFKVTCVVALLLAQIRAN